MDKMSEDRTQAEAESAGFTPGRCVAVANDGSARWGQLGWVTSDWGQAGEMVRMITDGKVLVFMHQELRTATLAETQWARRVRWVAQRLGYGWLAANAAVLDEAERSAHAEHEARSFLASLRVKRAAQ